MKKAVLWMIAAMMILGSLKTFASDDVTAGKLDAVAQDSLESDIQADITEGKVQAAMADLLIVKTKKHIADIDALIDQLASYRDTGNLTGGISQTVTMATLELEAADGDIKKLEQVEKESAEALKNLSSAVENFLLNNP